MKVKRVLSVLAIALVAAALAPSGVTAAPKKQVVDGNILLPAPYTDDSGCYAGLHRRGAIVTQGNNNGVIGWHFDVDPKTAGKKFKIDTTGQGSYVDLDITFYQDFKTINEVATDPLNAGSPAVYEVHTRAAGGEKGVVPKGFPKAIICMYGGDLGAGALSNFTYTAG